MQIEKLHLGYIVLEDSQGMILRNELSKLAMQFTNGHPLIRVSHMFHT